MGRTRPSCTRWNSPTVWPGRTVAGSSPDFALERRLELAQGGVLADAADEPARDLIAALIVEVARRLRRQHHAEAGRAGALQEALQRLGRGRLGVGRDVEIGLVEHDDGLQLVVRIALAEAQSLRQELRHPEEDVFVVAEEARVDDGQARAALAGVGAEAEQRIPCSAIHRPPRTARSCGGGGCRAGRRDRAGSCRKGPCAASDPTAPDPRPPGGG